MFALGSLGDIVAGILERDELAPRGMVDRIIKLARLAFGSYRRTAPRSAWVNFTKSRTQAAPASAADLPRRGRLDSAGEP